MHICPNSWAVGISKKIWIQTYFVPVTVDSVLDFHHLAIWSHGTKLTSFQVFLVPEKCISSFCGASIKPIKNLATLVPK